MPVVRPLLLGLLLLVQPAVPAMATAAPAADSAARTSSAPADATGTPAPPDPRDLAAKDRPPRLTSQESTRLPLHSGRTKALACDPAQFTGRTGPELVEQIKSVKLECINSLFSLTGQDAHGAFRQEQMVTVANAYRDNAVNYPGDNSTKTAQLVLYLRAGYYAQYNDPESVGEYGPELAKAVREALNSFFSNEKSKVVNDRNGQTLSEAVTLIDSAEQNAHFLDVVKRLLNDYDASYNEYYYMVTSVNNVYTVLFRGHYLPEFVEAVRSDPSVLETVHTFAADHMDLLGGENGVLTSNAGRELARFLQHQDLRQQLKPMLTDLLGRSEMTGPTAPLWVGIAEMTDEYDKANCGEYGTCNLQQRLKDAVLTVEHSCGPAITIHAQEMTDQQSRASCDSLTGQNAFFHEKVKDGNQPVADDHNDTINVVVFDSTADYQTYAGAIYGIDTNNGGMYLEGDPSKPDNQPLFVAYEAEWERPDFQIWNLNHEYTHYLDGRFDMYGDYQEGSSTPTVWWVEGLGEYISYSYREIPYQEAIDEAGRKTYPLSELFNTDVGADQTRTYQWGYLAVRYMFEKHPDDVDTVLGHYRKGEWQQARQFLTQTIGTNYDQDWFNWLDECSSGACQKP